MGRFEQHLITPPQILGCERLPFLILCGLVAFLIVVVFGVDIFGIAGGALIFHGGIRWLRAMFEQDPHWFAMRWLALTVPRRLPDELPPACIEDWAFVGFDDPPTPEAIFGAWLTIAAILVVPAGLAAVLSGPVAGGLTYAGLLLAVVAWAFAEDIARAVRRRIGRARSPGSGPSRPDVP